MKTKTGNLCALLGVAYLSLTMMTGCYSESITSPSGSSKARHVETDSQNLAASGVERLMASTTNGEIDLTAGGSSQLSVVTRLEVRAPTQHEASEFARLVERRAERNGDVIEIDNTYPDLPDGIEVEVTYEIVYPAGLDLVLETVNGLISIDGSTGMVTAGTVNGAITLEGRGGPFVLGAVNGTIRATIEDMEESGNFSAVNGNLAVDVRGGGAPVNMTVTNGNLALTLHDAFCGRLDASMSNGPIHCAVPLGGDHGSTPYHVWGSIGSGCSTPVTLRGANGRIDVALSGTRP